MKKGSFIPKDFRPVVPGSKLQFSEYSMSKPKFSEVTSESCILFISAKDDIIPDYFLREIDYSDAIKHHYYDDLGTIWDFSFSDRYLKIFTTDGGISPLSIYHRHPGVSLEHPYYQKHIAFFEILDIWKGVLLGQKRDHYQNFSKGYQGITSIKSSNLLSKKKIKYPRSFFVKGDYRLLRSKLNNLPTLFQEKISGKDIRVHVCGNVVWSLKVETKDCVDYRYASRGSVSYKEIQLPFYVKKIADLLLKLKKNKFIGVDLMKTNNNYYCFESNPGPGWSTYPHSSKKIFANDVFKQLIRK